MVQPQFVHLNSASLSSPIFRTWPVCSNVQCQQFGQDFQYRIVEITNPTKIAMMSGITSHSIHKTILLFLNPAQQNGLGFSGSGACTYKQPCGVMPKDLRIRAIRFCSMVLAVPRFVRQHSGHLDSDSIGRSQDALIVV